MTGWQSPMPPLAFCPRCHHPMHLRECPDCAYLTAPCDNSAPNPDPLTAPEVEPTPANGTDARFRTALYAIPPTRIADPDRRWWLVLLVLVALYLWRKRL